MKIMKRLSLMLVVFVYLSLGGINKNWACCDGPFFPPPDEGTWSCGVWGCENIPDIPPPTPPPPPSCGYGGSCD